MFYVYVHFTISFYRYCLMAGAEATNTYISTYRYCVIDFCSHWLSWLQSCASLNIWYGSISICHLSATKMKKKTAETEKNLFHVVWTDNRRSECKTNTNIKAKCHWYSVWQHNLQFSHICIETRRIPLLL